jgi:hypothetical protein
MRRETGLDLPAHRFAVLASYSFVWQRRSQPPVENGTADLSTVHVLELTEEEASKIVLDPKEYSDARWFAADEVLNGPFHPALQTAVRDLHARACYRALERAVAAGSTDQAITAAARALVAAHGASETWGDGRAVKVRFNGKTYERVEGVYEGAAP